MDLVTVDIFVIRVAFTVNFILVLARELRRSGKNILSPLLRI